MALRLAALFFVAATLGVGLRYGLGRVGWPPGGETRFGEEDRVLATAASRVLEPRAIARPYLGITYVPLTAHVAEHYGLDVDRGVLITAVAAGSPAQRAGIEAGDVLNAFEDQALTPEVSLLDLLWQQHAGSEVRLAVWRNGEIFNTRAVLTER